MGTQLALSLLNRRNPNRKRIGSQGQAQISEIIGCRHASFYNRYRNFIGWIPCRFLALMPFRYHGVYMVTPHCDAVDASSCSTQAPYFTVPLSKASKR